MEGNKYIQGIHPGQGYGADAGIHTLLRDIHTVYIDRRLAFPAVSTLRRKAGVAPCNLDLSTLTIDFVRYHWVQHNHAMP